MATWKWEVWISQNKLIVLSKDPSCFQVSLRLVDLRWCEPASSHVSLSFLFPLITTIAYTSSHWSPSYTPGLVWWGRVYSLYPADFKSVQLERTRLKQRQPFPEEGEGRGRGWSLTHEYPETGHMGMVQSCDRGGSDWTLGRISLLRKWSNTGTGFLERWWMTQTCQCLRGICRMPSITCFNFFVVTSTMKSLGR